MFGLVYTSFNTTGKEYIAKKKKSQVNNKIHLMIHKWDVS